MKMSSKYLILAIVSALIIAIDQVTKIYVHTHFQLGEMYVVLNDYFNMTYVRNTGAAWGIFHDAQQTFRSLFFLSMPPIAMIFILSILRGLPDSERLQTLALSLIFGGAIGNYIDRLRFGYVIDFLDFHWRTFYTYPAFNVADSSIVIGVSVLVLIMFRQHLQEQKTNKKKA